ncbi:hypothetical protein EMIT048CA2_260033 [Pseudomonas chlororaphis]
MPVLPRQRTLALHRPAVLRRRLPEHAESRQGHPQPLRRAGGVDEERRRVTFVLCGPTGPASRGQAAHLQILILRVRGLPAMHLPDPTAGRQSPYNRDFS